MGTTSNGTPGGSLLAGTFAANADVARIGAAAERRTAKLLDALARERGFTVLHDLAVPGSSANIDHVVVNGRDVWLIDTKQWAAGFYWTGPGGHVHRGWRRFTAKDKAGNIVFPAEKRTLPMAVDALSRRIPSARLHRPLLAVWPATSSLWALRTPGADTVHATDLGRHLPRNGKRPDQVVLAGLKGLLL